MRARRGPGCPSAAAFLLVDFFSQSKPTVLAACRWDALQLQEEEEYLEQEEEEEEEEEEGEPRPKTLKYYLRHLHDPILPGAPISVLQYCYIRIQEKLRSKTHDTYFDRDCRFFCECCGPAEDNFRPPSLDMVRKILGTRAAHECERDVCVCDRHVFETLSPKDYRRHKEQKCPRVECRMSRFVEVGPTCSPDNSGTGS